jgi:hypothetical protein
MFDVRCLEGVRGCGISTHTSYQLCNNWEIFMPMRSSNSLASAFKASNSSFNSSSHSSKSKLSASPSAIIHREMVFQIVSDYFSLALIRLVFQIHARWVLFFIFTYQFFTGPVNHKKHYQSVRLLGLQPHFSSLTGRLMSNKKPHSFFRNGVPNLSPDHVPPHWLEVNVRGPQLR